MLDFLKSRFSQGSSHAGIAALLQASKFFFPAYTPVIDAATALFAAVAVAVNN